MDDALDRESHRHRCSQAKLAVDFQFIAMELGQRIDQRQSQAGAVEFSIEVVVNLANSHQHAVSIGGLGADAAIRYR